MSNTDIKSWSSQHQEEFLENAYLGLGDTYQLQIDPILIL